MIVTKELLALAAQADKDKATTRPANPSDRQSALQEAIERLKFAVGDHNGSIVCITKADACVIGQALTEPRAGDGDAIVNELKDRTFPNHECPAESAAVWNVALYEFNRHLAQRTEPAKGVCETCKGTGGIVYGAICPVCKGTGLATPRAEGEVS